MMEFELRGVKDFTDRLHELVHSVPLEVAKGLYKEAQNLMTEAKRRTPVDTGNLKNSGHVGEPVFGSDGIGVLMGFGGPTGIGNHGGESNSEDVHYAFYVHENFAHHPTGQWKYLESVLNERSAQVMERVCRRALGEAVGRLPRTKSSPSGVNAFLAGETAWNPFEGLGVS